MNLLEFCIARELGRLINLANYRELSEQETQLALELERRVKVYELRETPAKAKGATHA